MSPRSKKGSKVKRKAKDSPKGKKVLPEDTKEKKLPDECSICFLAYTDNGCQRPHILPCCHTFCTLCISNNIVKGLITCPKCRAKHEFSSEIEWTVAELNREMERKGRTSRLGTRLHFAHEKVAGDLEESEKRLEKLIEMSEIITSEVQKGNLNAAEENQYLYLLVIEERDFIIEVEQNMDHIRDRLMDVLTGLKLAETDREVQILTIEAAIYKNGLKRNEALIKDRQPRLVEICERVNYLLEKQGKPPAKFEGRKEDAN
ncbi:E3 ubiquitin-protein ligase RFWD3-like isoform X2 [Macrobrachium rosenbergii]|uniref:E3 ubiquitin-protein ligase RFWD3-like isoform X2 n=1 Tax=Macrobrachium rosenbergii TaxID=79674 RepID=UPI0034D645EE